MLTISVDIMKAIDDRIILDYHYRRSFTPYQKIKKLLKLCKGFCKKNFSIQLVFNIFRIKIIFNIKTQFLII